MNYEASKQLTDARFKRLVGVQRTTFEEILAVLKTAYQLKHAKGGRKPKVCDIIIKKKDLGVYYGFFGIYLKD
ncbi:IS1381%2C transposase OrfA [Streptococcus pneumoniae]|nr:IS1381%2C transposase OrfA [Streptococcus pneumoniae]